MQSGNRCNGASQFHQQKNNIYLDLCAGQQILFFAIIIIRQKLRIKIDGEKRIIDLSFFNNLSQSGSRCRATMKRKLMPGGE